MIGRALRATGMVVLFTTLLWGVGRLWARRYTEGEAASDEFSLAAICGGAERTSTARALRRGRVVAVCGGIELDLREAALDPDGAELLVQATMGGVQVIVPGTWRVSVDADAKAGGVETHVTSPDELPDDAPELRVRAVARMGGVMVTTEGDAG